MKKIFIHSPIFRILTPPVYGIIVYLIILLINNTIGQVANLVNNQEMYTSMVLSLISFESMRLTIVLLERFNLKTKSKIGLQLISTLVVSVGIVLFAISQYYRQFIGFDISSRELLLFGSIFGLTALLYNALYFGNQYLQEENTTRIEQEQKLRENLESEFLSFRQEINPDLLYDSLEELILCLHRNAETAEEMIDSLAALYRYQLVNRQKEFVSLEEELVAVNHLMRLVSQKNPAIAWKEQIKNTDQIQLMPGALITAVDSIVRNSLASHDAPLVLTLSQEDEDYFVLHHLINDRLQLHPESLGAFQRLQRSYSVYSDRPFVQVKAGRENFIKFPLISISQSVAEPA